MYPQLKETIHFFVFAVFLWLLLWINRTFAEGSSEGLFVAVGFVLYGLWRSQTTLLKIWSDFEPFTVTIQPNWKQILIDHDVVDEAGWKKVYEKIEKNKSFKKPLSFSVLALTGKQNYLIHYPEYKTFATRVYVSESIDELGEPAFGSFINAPTITLTEGVEGYEIRFEAKVHDEIERPIVLTVIPYSLFGNLHFFKKGVASIEETKRKLEKYNWKRDESSDDAPWAHLAPLEFDHKYCKLRWNSL